MLGSPIRHSLSPTLHRAAYADLGLTDWEYNAYDIGAGDLAGFVDQLDDDWAGLSLTMPLKYDIVPMLQHVHGVAADLNVVNTVVRHETGELHGYNTDVAGIMSAFEAVERSHPDLLNGAAVDHACVVGSGATAASAILAMAQRGVTRLTVCARRREPAEKLAALSQSVGLTASVVPLSELSTVQQAARWVSTLPSSAAHAVTSQVLPSDPRILLDVAYDPWPSPVATWWEKAGGVSVSGLDMLVWQAIDQVELMTGRAPRPKALFAALGGSRR